MCREHTVRGLLMTSYARLITSISVAAALVATSNTSSAQTPAPPATAKPAPAAPAAKPAAAAPAAPAAAKPAAGTPAPAKPAAATAEKINVVLVRGAFADGSSWNKVIPVLISKGYNVVASR
jgi:hypothetical protein